ncbi:hypothetical protein POM88_037819 [Heracleum sosnowskyi]|uniref:Uncharacterized protein n=1 Tax=Heracleum sosnowskyi TaxID=360622 RepID=A0AAD8HSM3_9APIA|nr:hypothetical protein POM88_037819 [Heracleum sosnowskyi]
MDNFRELNSSSDSERVVGQVKPMAIEINSDTSIPFQFKVPAPVEKNPPQESREKSVNPISEQARFKANQSWIKKMQDTAQWEWDYLYMEWDLRDLLNIPKLARLEF